MPDVNLTYESFKKEHNTYFRVAEILSNHYFNELSDVIYLNIDIEDLNLLFEDFLSDNENGLDFLVTTCIELLGNIERIQDSEKIFQEWRFSDSPNFYQNLIDLTTKWEEEGIEEPHPAIPFISLFITIATQMGESELNSNENQNFDFRDYYGPLHNTLRLSSHGKTKPLSDKYFKMTFSDEGEKSSNLFKKFSIWVESEFPGLQNTFKTSEHRRHQDWILNQALINSKDIYELASFFKYSRIIRESNPDKNLLFTKLKEYIISRPIKAKSFSKSLRNFIRVPEFSETIASIVKIKFDNWDGDVVTSDKHKLVELLHRIEIDTESKKIIKISGEFDLNSLENFNLEEFKITNSSSASSEFDVFNDDTSTKCFIDLLDKIYLESTQWKVDSPNFKIKVATYDKRIMVFQLDDSQTAFNPNPVWKEVNNNETLRSEETYLALCKEDQLDVLVEYLDSNSDYLATGDYSYTSDIDGNQYYVVRDIRLHTNRSSEGKSEYLDIFYLKERQSSLIELTNGLMSSERIYLFNELPDIIIPKEYINENSEIKLSINGSDYDFKISTDAVLYSKEYSYILDKETEEVEISYFFESSEENVLNYKDSVKFYIKNPTYINDINAGKMAYNLQYDFGTEKVYWKSYFPDTLLQDARENGYLSGGQFNIPSIKYENMNSLDYEKKEFSYSKKTEKLIFIGRNPLLLLQYSINESSENWMDNFQKHKNLYLFGQEQVFNDGIKSSIQLGTLNLEEFQPFHEMKKKIEDDFTWVIKYNSNLLSQKIKIFQIGKKSPKGLETSDHEELEKLNKWKNIILEIKKQINTSEITLDSELDIGLLNKYIEKAEML